MFNLVLCDCCVINGSHIKNNTLFTFHRDSFVTSTPRHCPQTSGQQVVYRPQIVLKPTPDELKEHQFTPRKSVVLLPIWREDVPKSLSNTTKKGDIYLCHTVPTRTSGRLRSSRVQYTTTTRSPNKVSIKKPSRKGLTTTIVWRPRNPILVTQIWLSIPNPKHQDGDLQGLSPSTCHLLLPNGTFRSQDVRCSVLQNPFSNLRTQRQTS